MPSASVKPASTEDGCQRPCRSRQQPKNSRRPAQRAGRFTIASRLEKNHVCHYPSSRAVRVPRSAHLRTGARPAGAAVAAIGQQQEGIRAVLVVSPHWQTRGEVRVMATAQPETIHDFGGFPAEALHLAIPRTGCARCGATGLSVAQRCGLSHHGGRPPWPGPWGLGAAVSFAARCQRCPVFQVSLPFAITANSRWRWARHWLRCASRVCSSSVRAA